MLDNFKNITYDFSVFGLLLLTSSIFSEKIAVFSKIKIAGNYISIFMSTLSLALLLPTNRHFSLVIIGLNLILLGIQLRKKPNNYYLPLSASQWLITLVFNQLLLTGFYANLLEVIGLSISGPFFSILLVIHAITLLFFALKQQIKLLNQVSVTLFLAALLNIVFHDIRDFGSTEKVIVLIIVGICLLGASFLFVKLKDRFEKKIIEVDLPIE